VLLLQLHALLLALLLLVLLLLLLLLLVLLLLLLQLLLQLLLLLLLLLLQLLNVQLLHAQLLDLLLLELLLLLHSVLLLQLLQLVQLLVKGLRPQVLLPGTCAAMASDIGDKPWGSQAGGDGACRHCISVTHLGPKAELQGEGGGGGRRTASSQNPGEVCCSRECWDQAAAGPRRRCVGTPLCAKGAPRPSQGEALPVPSRSGARLRCSCSARA